MASQTVVPLPMIDPVATPPTIYQMYEPEAESSSANYYGNVQAPAKDIMASIANKLQFVPSTASAGSNGGGPSYAPAPHTIGEATTRPSSTSGSHAASGNMNGLHNASSQMHMLDSLLLPNTYILAFKKASRNIRPWPEFYSLQLFSLPYNSSYQRLSKNLPYFAYNYIFLYLACLLLCIFLMPLLLILMVALIGSFIYLSHQGTIIQFRNAYSIPTNYVRWCCVLTFAILFFCFVRPAVFFLLIFIAIAIVVHSVLHVGARYEKLQADENFDDV